MHVSWIINIIKVELRDINIALSSIHVDVDSFHIGVMLSVSGKVYWCCAAIHIYRFLSCL